ncbi:MAG: PLP-dependent aspartate aminotransferase family protein [Halobacteria archaeon]
MEPNPPVTDPPYLSSSYRLEGPGKDSQKYLYRRYGNPTREKLEESIADLEAGNHGFCYSSGTAAISSVLFASTDPGDRVVAADNLYAGTHSMLENFFSPRYGTDLRYVDPTDLDEIEDAVDDGTSLVFMESMSNPLLKIPEVWEVAKITREQDAVLAIDNTFVTPVNFKPLRYGADVAIESTSKYINGHTDVVGGSVVTDDGDLSEVLGFQQTTAFGNIQSPSDCYRTLCGMKTLRERMRKHQKNAGTVVETLEDHPGTESVLYPGDENHPQHRLASELFEGYSGIVSFELSDKDSCVRFLENLEVIIHATSLGGVESLAEHPGSLAGETEGESVPGTLVRISVGIENTDELTEDVEQALDKATDC